MKTSVARQRDPLRQAVVWALLLALVPGGSAPSAAQVLTPSHGRFAAEYDTDAAPASRSVGSRAVGLVTVRRTLGLAFLAGGTALAMRGFDYKDEADSFYHAYEVATDEAEIDRLYQRTTNRDVKSQVSWALAAAFGITGLRLVFTGGGDDDPFDSRHRRAQSASVSTLRVQPDFTPQSMGLRLQRRFH